MIRYDNSQIVPQLHVDIVRLNAARMAAIRAACKDPAYTDISAFLEVYDYHAVVILHRGNEEQHIEFMNHLNSLM
ncbi:hypothetical protein PHABIO_391 [Pseudomonas phage Phabio]|uniref:Uncharacterized protein n=1 Tax=Pseudomonas phage Phabio TaxID=2006668 RepID=A0A1Y0SU50_9CAUD|nr:hypothetical protein MZD05_gp391 [Pseudomonas phage Phabio]ARV77022.1 hypothetical protein PHABIO_391 [Pseudomonas phage Phabio]